jgi:PAS domain S-box-containing protein
MACANLLRCAFGFTLGLSQLTQAQQSTQAPLEHVKLQLKWTHQFQFAGFYTAVEKGYYRDAGLEVEVIEGRSGVDFIKEVAAGKAEYGIEMPDLLLRRNSGEPVVVIAALFQHSPIALMSLANSSIRSPHDLASRRVMLRQASEADLRAMIISEGLTLDKIKVVEHSFNVESLIRGEVDAMSVYASDFATDLQSRGISFHVMRAIDYGIDFYGDCLFTSERELSKHSKRVRRFREASLRGWEYAMDHPQEIAQLIHDKYAPQKSVAWLQAEAEAMQPLFLHQFVEIGHMNLGRWRHIGDTYVKLGMLPVDYSLEGFLYNPEPAHDNTWPQWLAAIAGVGLLAVSVAAVFLLAFNRKLGSAVRERTVKLRESEGQFRSLVESAPEAIFVQSEGRFVYINPPLIKLLGASRPEDLLGRDCMKHVAPEFHAAIQERIRIQRETGRPVPPMEQEYIRLDGSRLIVETTAVAINYLSRQSHLVFVRDVIERKRAEDALRESEERFRRLSDASLEGIMIHEGGVILDVNLAFARLFGYEHPEEIIGQNGIGFLLTAESSDRILQRINRQEQGPLEVTGLRRDGSVFAAETDSRSIKFRGHDARIVFCRDITEHKRATTLLSARAELADIATRGKLDDLLQSALDKAEMLTGSCIGFFHFVEADQQNLSLQTWSTNTLRNMCTAEGKGRHYPVSEAGVWVDCLRERKPVIHNDYASLKNKKGLPPGHAPVVREAVVPIVRNDCVVCIMGVGNKSSNYTAEDVRLLEDIASIVADQAIRLRAEETQARLATVVEQAVETIVITDAQGMIQYVNPAFEKTTGYSRAEALGQNPRMIKSGKHDAEFYRRMWDTLKQGEVWHGHVINRHKDGRLYEEEATISPVRDAAGKVVNYVAVKYDVTREVQLESQLRQSQKLEAVGQLAGGVAHDFNNILAATMLNLSMLLENENLDVETRAGLKDLEASAERAASLTRQLLMFSRRSVLETKVLDLNELVDNLLKMLGRLLGDHIELVFERSNNLPSVEADVGMLEQVLMNLTVNARDAMPKGGRIGIRTAAAQISDTDVDRNANRRSGRFVCLSVTDTGCGMDEATLARIFEPFFTTKETGKGTGLGLATVDGIVAQHRGWVEVDSRLGQGTVFRVYLPVSPTPVKAAVDRKIEVAPSGSETLLVVEDETAVRQTLVQALRGLGYRVFEASNGQEAMKLWKEHDRSFDLLVTDMIMPEGMTGLELAERIREDKPGMKVIISSGHAAEITNASTLAKASIFYLPKPYKVPLLGKMVRECLDKL